MTFDTLRPPEVLTAYDPSMRDLLSFVAGRGHHEFPCLARSHNPSGCVPAMDFSPWLRERVRSQDVEGLGEYLWRVRRASPDGGGSGEQVLQRYSELAHSVMTASLDHHLRGGTDEAYVDLRVTLILLAAHEIFSGFIMAGEAADFAAGVMVPHGFALADAALLVERRNHFVSEMGREMDYWACWAPLSPDAIHPPFPPREAGFQALLSALATLPLGARAHAVDALRHLSTEPGHPRSLASLSRYETRRRGVDVTESARLILETGLMIPASDAGAWLSGWTRRDLLAFLSQCGQRAPKSWSKERLAEMALVECAEGVCERMAESGAVELAPDFVEGAARLGTYIEDVKETWRVWLGFGTGIK